MPLSLSPSLKLKQTKDKTKPPASKAREGEPAGFLEFWARYPRKEARKEALKAWRHRIGGSAAKQRTLQDNLRAWLAEFVDRIKRDHHKRHVPKPASFINSDEWESPPDTALVPDEPPPPLNLTPQLVREEIIRAKKNWSDYSSLMRTDFTDYMSILSDRGDEIAEICKPVAEKLRTNLEAGP